MTGANGDVRELVVASWRRATAMFEAAVRNARAGDRLTAVSRAYYAVLHATRALLATKGLMPKSHSGTKTLFGQEFVRTGMLPRWMGVAYSSLSEMRTAADYDVKLSDPTPQATEQALEDARRFLEEARRYLAEGGYIDGA